MKSPDWRTVFNEEHASCYPVRGARHAFQIWGSVRYPWSDPTRSLPARDEKSQKTGQDTRGFGPSELLRHFPALTRA
jgi:hypothetical protein